MLFRKGSLAKDGMFTVVKGTLGVYAEDDVPIPDSSKTHSSNGSSGGNSGAGTEASATTPGGRGSHGSGSGAGAGAGGGSTPSGSSSANVLHTPGSVGSVHSMSSIQFSTATAQAAKPKLKRKSTFSFDAMLTTQRRQRTLL